MTPSATVGSPALKARIAGALWLISIAGGLYAEMGVRGALIVRGNAAATAAHIVAAQPLYRLGFVADLLGLMAYMGVTILFYDLLKPVNRSVSRFAAAFGLAGCALLGASLIDAYAPLVVLSGDGSMNGLMPQAPALVLVFLRLFSLGYWISIALFAVQVGGLGWLVLRSTFLPRFLGALLLLEAACNLVSSFGRFLDVQWIGRLESWLLLPGLPAEGGMTLWLLIMGVNARAWATQATRLQGVEREPVLVA